MFTIKRKQSDAARLVSGAIYATGALALCWVAAVSLNAIAGWFGAWGFLALIMIGVVLTVTGIA